LEVLELLEEFEEYFRQMNVIWLVMYPLIWSILIDGFYDIAVRMEGLLDSVLSFGGVMQSETVQDIYNYLTPIAFAFLALAIIGISIQLIAGKSVQKTNILLNTVLAVAVITLLPWFIMQLSQFSDDAIEVSKSAGVEDNIEVSALSTQIVQTNTRDVVYLARNDFEEADNGINNTITDGNIRNIDFTEVVHPDPDESGERNYGESVSGNAINEDEVFSSKIVDDEEGNAETTDLEPFELPFIGEIPFLNEYYYRYTGNFVNMFVQLGVFIAVMLFTSLKVVRLFFEILFANLIAPFVAASDLSTGQRIKNLLKDMAINFAVVGLVMLVFKLYTVMMNYLSTLELNAIVVTVIMLALGLATIDGPDQAKKLLGVDIGVKDGYRQLMAGLALGSVATKSTSGLRSHLSNEKDKFSQQRQERKDAKEQLKGGLGSKGNDSPYSIEQDLNKAMNNQGMMQNKDKNKSDKGMGEESQIASNVAGEGRQVDGKTSDVISNMVNDQNNNIGQDERQALNKALNSGATELNDSERKILENVASNSDISTDERQAVASLMNGAEDTTMQTSQQDVLSNMIQSGEANVDSAEREVLEKLIEDPSSVSAEEKQVLENLIQGDSVGTQERQAIESLMSDTQMNDTPRQAFETTVSQADTPTSEATRNVLENIVSSDTGAISQAERQIIDRFSENPNSLTPTERSVMENITSNSSVEPQHRQAIEEVLSANPSSETMSRQVVQNLSNEGTMTAPDIQQNVVRMMNDGFIKPQEADAVIDTLHSPTTATVEQREVVENIVSNRSDIGATERQAIENVVTQSAGIGTQERQVLEKVMQAPDTVTQSERQVLENVVSNDSNLTGRERTAIENVVSHHVSQGDTQQNVHRNVIDNDSGSSHQTKTEDIVRNMQTNFNVNSSSVDNVKRKYDEINRKQNNINYKK